MSEQKPTREVFQPVDTLYNPIAASKTLSIPEQAYQAFEVFRCVEEHANLYELETRAEILERNSLKFAEFLSILGANQAALLEQELVTHTHMDPIIRGQLKRRLVELLENIVKFHQPPPTAAEISLITKHIEHLDSLKCAVLPSNRQVSSL